MSFKKIKRSFMIALLVSTASVLQNAYAQDYPYDDVQLKRDENALSRENSGAEEPGASRGSNSKRRLPAVFRIGVKVGGNFALYQEPTSTSSLYGSSTNNQTTGFGFESLLALSWDLPYQPIFLEVETGYRRFFVNTPYPLHDIPLEFGIYYRNRVGVRTEFNIGVKSGFDARIQTDPINGISSFAIDPSFTVSALLETGGFLIEPLITANRLQSNNLFFIIGLRTGFRF